MLDPAHHRSRTATASAHACGLARRVLFDGDSPSTSGCHRHPFFGRGGRRDTKGPSSLSGLGPDDTAFSEDAAQPYRVEISIDDQRLCTGRPAHLRRAGPCGPERGPRRWAFRPCAWGGNRSVLRYNWKTQADNAGSDWFFLNGRPARWSEFIDGNPTRRPVELSDGPDAPLGRQGAGGLELLGREVRTAERRSHTLPIGATARGPTVRRSSAMTRSDASVASTPDFKARAIRGLPHDPAHPPSMALDNEPMLWHATHRDVFPQACGYEECHDRGVALAAAIKAADPNGLSPARAPGAGPTSSIRPLDEGPTKYATHADRKAHGDKPFLAWYLAAMKSASRKQGKRLLDYVDVHFYPQGQADGQMVYGPGRIRRAMQALRIRSTRGLWDPSYRDESWIHEPVMLIPRIRSWIAQEYAGTKLAIGEYSWGGDDDPSGAIAQAEILGILGRENVDTAFYWAGLEGMQRFAFQLYRNPDGSGAGFGDRAISCRSTAPDRLSAFAARSARRGAHDRAREQGPRQRRRSQAAQSREPPVRAGPCSNDLPPAEPTWPDPTRGPGREHPACRGAAALGGDGCPAVRRA